MVTSNGQKIKVSGAVSLFLLAVTLLAPVTGVKGNMSLLDWFLEGENGWTRGQYAVFRILLGFHLFITSVVQILMPGGTNSTWLALLSAVSGVLSVLFIFGFYERTVSFLLASLWALFFGILPVAPHFSEPLLVFILLAHTELVPARKSSDPEEAVRWRLPQPIHSLIWIIAILFYTVTGALMLFGRDYPIFTVLYLAAPVAVFPQHRKWIWILLTLLAVYLVAALGNVCSPLLLVQLFLFDPHWIRGRGGAKPDKLFYDGGCGLCHRIVLFILKEDRQGNQFVFSPLQGETFMRDVPEDRRVTLPDSNVVVTDSGDILVKSAAVIRVGMRLGGLWLFAAALLWCIPFPLRDLGYDLVARLRKRLFRKPNDLCPVVPVPFLRRFLP